LRTSHQDGPIEGFVFTVTGPNIHVRNVDFVGAAPTELVLLQTAAKKMLNQEFLRSKLRIQADKDLVPIYLERGYLKAAFSDAEPKVVQESPQESLVDVTFAVDPGRQYKTTDIQLSGNKVFPTDKLRPLVRQQLSQPANAVQLQHDLEAVKKLYGTRGYVAASTEALAETDDAQSTVKYLLQIQEGSVFKMGDLDIRGLDKRATERLFTEWKLLAGDPYDSSYPQRFLKEAADDLLGEWNIAIHESPNDKDQTVDVSLRFEPKPR
jgi:outer membrane protein assembly factor BamA